MDRQSLNGYREALLKLQEELRESLSHFGTTTGPVAPDRAIGRLTRMEALQSQQMALEMKRRNQARLQSVARALARIDDGSYGVCLKCEEPISARRLEVHPETPVCIDCAR
jgi:DnaK suppressor protein